MTLYFNTAVVKEGSAEPVIESLNITPTAQQQVIEAPSGVDGYSPITVAAAAEPVIESLSVTPTASQQLIEAPEGVDGYSPITVAAAPQPVIQSLSVTPSSSQQIIEAPSGVDGYSPITVAAVTEPDVTFEFHAAAQADIWDSMTGSFTTATRPATGILHLNRGCFEKMMLASITTEQYNATIHDLFFANSDIIVTVNNSDFVFKGECSIYDSGDDIYDSYDDVYRDGLLGQTYISYTTSWGQTDSYFYPVGSCPVEIDSSYKLTTNSNKGFMSIYATGIMFMEYRPGCNKGYSFDITVNQDGSFSFSNFEYIPEEFS